MMAKMGKKQISGHKTVSCDQCNTQISLLTALTAEGADYVKHFCGKACYNAWLAEHTK
ncbi:DUF3330 domain-containing protein [Coxiella burnetii]|uniref:TRASH domain-containing protein n=2 Tax=Coxiella burnetii TaxID=777 RepID=Q83CZ0_COXBU|nr:DUF3330 domain-containing protein [Coxiella burnetii]NP_819969.2 hypothetical protein CBU_0961 [Coxiella burnetii RSA 493]AAO90483.2 hypothetical protein CBU_0961 [Coxiella burnetii RSA 493]ARI65787.1 hypothetical protein B7L74_04925 [Coxiella burnetii]MCF2092817.1 DUF3330 domain-containing protein [Coxiella burnetii]MCF2094987.1 DUF3330 domain-containing protein [Coxiella burnetii]MCF2096886.1 DUF3330 domain-containing protein [Coxiella burnetii]